MINSIIKDAVIERIDTLATQHDIRILHAIESGSRAWGFPSPDSDYDARFIYIHRRDWYLSLFEGRDVVEDPIQTIQLNNEDVIFDVNGWDLKKALKLLLKGNAVVLEWLMSPQSYHLNPEFKSDMLCMWDAANQKRAQIHHYQSQLHGQWSREIKGQESVKIKKYFYALRPAIALMWILENPAKSRVPMDIQTLMQGCRLDPKLEAAIHELITKKAITRELGANPAMPIFNNFIEKVLETPIDVFEKIPLSDQVLSQAQQLFLKWVVD